MNYLKSLGLLIGLLLPILVKANLTDPRVWSDQNGRQIEATLISYDQDSEKGKFRRTDGYVVEIPLSMLSSEDQTLIKSLTAEQQPKSSNEDPAKETHSENYLITGLTKENTGQYIATSEGWEHDIQSLRVKIRFKGSSQPADKQYLKAYFYDRNNALIQTYGKPPRIEISEGNYADQKVKFKKNDTAELFFPLSAYLEERDWKRCIVVFGDNKEATARIYPSGDLSDFAFKERVKILGEYLSQITGDLPSGGAATEYKIVSARKSRFGSSAYVDEQWVEGARGILVTVKVRNALPTSKYFLKCHFFDSDDKKVLTANNPTMIVSDAATSTHTALPKFADINTDMIAFFPFDRKVENSDWRKAVLVFGDKDTVDTIIVGGNSDDLKSLNFPEKNRQSRQ